MLENIKKFVSIAPYSRARDLCNNNIDTVLLARNCNTGPQFERLQSFQYFTNFTFLKKYDSLEYIKRFVVSEAEPVADFFTAEVRPRNLGLLRKNVALQLPHDDEKLSEIYDVKDSRCAAWVFPYRVFDFKAVGMSVPYHLRRKPPLAFSNKRMNIGIPGNNRTGNEILTNQFSSSS